LRSYVPVDDLDVSPSKPTSVTFEDEVDDEDDYEQDEVRHD